MYYIIIWLSKLCLAATVGQHCRCQGLFLDFAQEGTNALWQISKGGGQIQIQGAGGATY